jgi:hypothetical protein
VPSERKALPPALLGNQRARTHGIYAAKLSPLEDAEVEQLADVVRELCPLDTAALEPAVQIIAGQFWRLQRAYSDLDENGVIRGRKDRGRLTPTFAAALDLEKALLTGLRELGMTSRRRGIGHDSASKLKEKASPISRTAGEGGRGWVGGAYF